LRILFIIFLVDLYTLSFIVDVFLPFLSYGTFRTFYARNYEEIKILNPNFPFLLRTEENCMPAVTTELEWKFQDVLRFMLQTGRFRNANGTIAEDRVEAAQAFLKVDWDALQLERWKVPGFDPDRPGITDEDWTPELKQSLAKYLEMKKAIDEQQALLKENDDYVRAENAVLMCQRVDLWCAGPKEVERAVVHLYKLGRKLNDREVDMPSYITDFIPGSHDIEDD
jgi:hypothetical protein